MHIEHGAVLTSDRVILATHVPLEKVLLTPRVAQYRSYVCSGRVCRHVEPLCSHVTFNPTEVTRDCPCPPAIR